MKKYIYHYCAHYQLPGDTRIHYIDGIATMMNKIVCMDDYNELKKLAVPSNYKITTIDSLSLLGCEDV